ncbi:hypothetical protein [Spirosoma sp. KUDC1026]|uniref:hypothetical protein n=1 Tax=Spirosoma sp. KUDC1026 TaxID=2745947 RepID=UPI00159BEA19|nr:hypothetical protein [Spirosoma sp. KUDC1026]QKZ13042.1 hypothetical protein HU175_10515 [Spirosoma sp. KUDC1026]
MSPISVYVNRQLDGVTYSLSPLSRKNFYEQFPNAHPSGSVFVNYDTKSDFETYHNRVERFVLPILLGLDDETIKTVGPVNFIDPRTNDLVFSYRNE